MDPIAALRGMERDIVIKNRSGVRGDGRRNWSCGERRRRLKLTGGDSWKIETLVSR